MEAIRQLPSRAGRCDLLSNEYVYDCQNNLATTSIHSLPCGPRLQPGHWWLCRTLARNCPLQNNDARFSRRRLPAKAIIIHCSLFMRSLLVIIFVQWTVASAPTPSAAVPCSGLCKRGDRSKYSEYSHCPVTAFPATEDP